MWALEGPPWSLPGPERDHGLLPGPRGWQVLQASYLTSRCPAQMTRGGGEAEEGVPPALVPLSAQGPPGEEGGSRCSC